MSDKIPVNKSDQAPASSAGKETIYVDVEDEITSIIDKVDSSQSKLVALVLPKRASALQSIVNMRLLKRNAESAGKNVVLITNEAQLLPLAGAAGLYVAKSLQTKPIIPPSPLDNVANNLPQPTLSSEPESELADEDFDEDAPVKPAKIDYNRSIGELAAAHDDDEPEVIALDDEQELPKPKTSKSSAPKQAKSQKFSVPNFEKFRLLLVGGIALFIALIIFIFMAIFVLPKANIVIQTNSSPISANLSLNASDKYTTLNEAASQIPSVLKATDQTSQQTATATGQQNQGNKATGVVKLTNCGNSSATVPAGTGVSSNGFTYITQSAITLSDGNFSPPPASTCKSTGTHVGTVNVIAQKGGTSYNLASGSSFSVAGFSSVTGTNTAAFSGGSDNNVTVISQKDVDDARSKVTSQSTDDFTNKFIKQLEDSGLYVLRSTLKVGDPVVTASPEVGQQASSSSVTIKINYSVLCVQKSDLTKAISDTLNEQIDKSKQKISESDVLKDASVSVQSQSSPAVATLNVSKTTTAVPIIEVATVKKLAVGKKSGDIKSAIGAWPGVKNVDVKLSPFWVSKTPKNQSKIHVTLQQVKN